jgi:Flp pilus assembly protein TadG
VTAETALALPVLVAVTLAMLWLVSLGLGQMRVVDAAREAARAVARGESPAEAERLSRIAAPGARVSIRTVDGVVRVRVEQVVRPGAGLVADLGAATLSAEAEGLAEASAQERGP